MKMYFQFFLVFYILNFSDVVYSQVCTENYEITFEDSICLSEHIFIDSVSNPANIWQVSGPNKTQFQDPLSLVNVIVTDSVAPYPINDTSSFFLLHGVGSSLLHYDNMILSGFYNVNSDSLNDYGLIEFSHDNGGTWIDIINDSNYFANTFWTHKPVLTGNSNGWVEFHLQLVDLGDSLGINWNLIDTVLFKFTFISDGNFDGLDGLMFDNFFVDDLAWGINETKLEALNSAVIPNPIEENTLVIQVSSNNAFHGDLIIVDQTGAIVQTINELSSNRIQVNISTLDNGLYYYQLIDKNDQVQSTGKFIK